MMWKNSITYICFAILTIIICSNAYKCVVRVCMGVSCSNSNRLLKHSIMQNIITSNYQFSARNFKIDSKIYATASSGEMVKPIPRAKRPSTSVREQSKYSQNTEVAKEKSVIKSSFFDRAHELVNKPHPSRKRPIVPVKLGIVDMIKERFGLNKVATPAKTAEEQISTTGIEKIKDAYEAKLLSEVESMQEEITLPTKRIQFFNQPSRQERQENSREKRMDEVFHKYIEWQKRSEGDDVSHKIGSAGKSDADSGTYPEDKELKKYKRPKLTKIPERILTAEEKKEQRYKTYIESLPKLLEPTVKRGDYHHKHMTIEDALATPGMIYKQLYKNQTQDYFLPFQNITRMDVKKLKVGEKHRGRVVGLAKYGLFVDIGAKRNALLHIKDMSKNYFVDNLRADYNIGDEIDVYIKFCDKAKSKFGLSLLPINKLMMNSLIQSQDMVDLKVGDEVNVTVRRLSEFAMFVELTTNISSSPNNTWLVRVNNGSREIKLEGYLHKRKLILKKKQLSLPLYKLYRNNQTITCRVFRIEDENSDENSLLARMVRYLEKLKGIERPESIPDYTPNKKRKTIRVHLTTVPITKWNLLYKEEERKIKHELIERFQEENNDRVVAGFKKKGTKKKREERKLRRLQKQNANLTLNRDDIFGGLDDYDSDSDEDDEDEEEETTKQELKKQFGLNLEDITNMKETDTKSKSMLKAITTAKTDIEDSDEEFDNLEGKVIEEDIDIDLDLLNSQLNSKLNGSINAMLSGKVKKANAKKSPELEPEERVSNFLKSFFKHQSVQSKVQNKRINPLSSDVVIEDRIKKTLIDDTTTFDEELPEFLRPKVAERTSNIVTATKTKYFNFEDFDASFSLETFNINFSDPQLVSEINRVYSFHYGGNASDTKRFVDMFRRDLVLQLKLMKNTYHPDEFFKRFLNRYSTSASTAALAQYDFPIWYLRRNTFFDRMITAKNISRHELARLGNAKNGRINKAGFVKIYRYLVANIDDLNLDFGNSTQKLDVLMGHYNRTLIELEKDTSQNVTESIPIELQEAEYLV